MARLTIADIRMLANSVQDSPESRVQKIFDWQYEQEMSIARWILAFSASLLVALSVAAAQEKIEMAGLNLLFFCAPVVLFFIGLFMIVRVGRIGRYYVISLHLINRFREVGDD